MLPSGQWYSYIVSVERKWFLHKTAHTTSNCELCWVTWSWLLFWFLFFKAPQLSAIYFHHIQEKADIPKKKKKKHIKTLNSHPNNLDSTTGMKKNMIFWFKGELSLKASHSSRHESEVLWSCNQKCRMRRVIKSSRAAVLSTLGSSKSNKATWNIYVEWKIAVRALNESFVPSPHAL